MHARCLLVSVIDDIAWKCGDQTGFGFYDRLVNGTFKCTTGHTGCTTAASVDTVRLLKETSAPVLLSRVRIRSNDSAQPCLCY